MIELTTIRVAPTTARHIKFLGKLQETSLGPVVARCITAGEIVSTENGASRQFYAGDNLLHLPKLTQSAVTRLIPLGFNLNPERKAILDAMISASGFCENSVIAWCIDCFNVISEARMLDMVHTRDNGGVIHFRVTHELP